MILKNTYKIPLDIYIDKIIYLRNIKKQSIDMYRLAIIRYQDNMISHAELHTLKDELIKSYHYTKETRLKWDDDGVYSDYTYNDIGNRTGLK